MMQWIIPTFFSVVFGFLVISMEGTENELLPDTVTFKADGRIVNGSKAICAQFPHMVSLRRRWTSSHFCGGSIIGQKWILTAGHCMFRNNEVMGPSTFYVVVGGVNLDDKEVAPRQVRYIDQLFVHPAYDGTYLVNDAALLLLQEPLVLTTPYVQAIPLAKITPENGTECIVSGWGYLKEDDPVVSKDLMYVNLPLLSRPTCKTLLKRVTKMTDGQICAGYIDGLRDACQGDSGGPLICNGNLTGIVSGGRGCARPDLPGFYTEVAHYRDWIDKIQSSGGSCCMCACDRKNSRSSATAASTSLTSAIVIFLSIY
ncbi:trypsin [Diachasma alloeum]|uniref:trypsin n=1 Tax=Diachasma alloeum TaxID=454923 RepID=UPI0007382D65|nr:trypsin [Diachasma alloeum]